MSLANCSSGIVRGADSWLSIGVDLPARRRGFRRISLDDLLLVRGRRETGIGASQPAAG
jgi:hypothetical protein